MAQIEQLKSEIADQYLEKYKQELDWLKKLALLPIEDEVKKVLTWQISLPEKFDAVEEFWRWKTIIPFFSQPIAEQIFSFMKEKRLEIEQRKTEKELASLKAEILTGKKSENPDSINDIPQNGDKNSPPSQNIDQNQTLSQTSSASESPSSQPNSALTGAAVWAGGAGLVYGGAKLLNTIEQKTIAKKLDVAQIQKNLTSSLDQIQRQAEAMKASGRLSSKQSAMLEKSLQKMAEGANSFDDEAASLIKERNRLNLSKQMLSVNLSPKQLEIIEDLAPQLVGKNVDEIQQILKSHHISGVSNEFAQALGRQAWPEGIKSMTTLLKNRPKLNRVLQTLSSMMVVDALFLGVDVFLFLENQKEAELIAKVNALRAENKMDQAYTQLGIGVASFALEALIVCAGAGSLGGPAGTLIGLWVGAVSAAASIGVDSLVFDVRDFYTQNREDFLRQKTTQLNHAILQGLHQQQHGNQSINEVIESITRWSVEAFQKAESFQDGIYSRVFLDEMHNGVLRGNTLLHAYLQSGKKKSDFIKDLTPDEKSNFDPAFAQIEQEIKQRIEYLNSQFLDNQRMQQLQNGNGVYYLNSLINNSRLYSQMKSENKRDQKIDFKANIAKYESDFFADFPKEKLTQLKNLQKTNPELYDEMLATVSLENMLQEDESDPIFTQNVQLVQKLRDRILLTQGKSALRVEIPDEAKNVHFMESFLKANFDLKKVKYSSPDLQKMLWFGMERRGNLNVAADPLQNVLYHLASELYGYTGANDQADLMNFFSESQGAVQWIYYSDQRKVNEDWRKDFSLETQLPSGFPKSELNQKVNTFMASEFGVRWSKEILRLPLMWGLMWWADVVKNGLWASSIDTPTETLDPHLQKEFEAKIRKILSQELSYRTLEYQKEVKSQISDFVAQHAQNGQYIELPYYLLIKAQKAGFGDLQRQFFTRKNNKLEKISMKSELGVGSALDAKANYLTPQREAYSAEEKKLIARVESAHQKLSALRSVQGTNSHEDDLDLPTEVESLIGDKYKQREKFKSDLLYYDVESAVEMQVMARYQEFAQYFEDLYAGLLISLTIYKTSNDIDTYPAYLQALQFGKGDFFDEHWSLKPVQENDLAILKNEDFRNLYHQELKKQKIWSQTIDQLRKSDDIMDIKLANQASKLILTTAIEEALLVKNAQSQITKISIWTAKIDMLLKSKKDLSAKISANLKSLDVPSTLVSDASKTAIQQLITSKIRPVALEKPQETLAQNLTATQRKIEQTARNVNRQDQRWELIYDPVANTLVSRGQTIKFEIKDDQLKLSGYPYLLPVQDAIWLANFVNRTKSKYRGKMIAFELEQRYDALVVKNADTKLGISDDIELISQDKLTQLCPFFAQDKGEGKIKTFASWLSSQIK